MSCKQSSNEVTVEPLIQPLPIPNTKHNRAQREEVRRRLQEPRDWNFFFTNFAWEFFMRHQNWIPIIERRLINDGNSSTYIKDKVQISKKAIREVLGWPEVDTDWDDDVMNLPMKKDIWDSLRKVLCHTPKSFKWTLNKYGDPKQLLSKDLKD
ncbi:OLC1v1013069C1 [Oldenlandia corymbosa var. corymbosa]|uniref:OLC1v1013069C1 n=1 Tax=Oldenlandia corymbosa var. corymbosa TaxID=529605 RepID=A0AAV1DXJ8_OLDCO|nr:OLC1v1013069C1 [Oldenlandia corymbosa var. corymbosa]